MNDKLTRQYDYKANSNLVLPTDTSLIDKRPSNEATGEVQSLAGRLSGKMGEKASSKQIEKSSKQEEEDKKRLKRELKRSKKDEPSRLKQYLNDPRGVSVADIDTEELLYRPKSVLTSNIYGLIIKFVRKQLGFQHSSIISGAADEVIGKMKDNELTEDSKRFQVERLIASGKSLSDDDFNEISNLCKKINDWDSDQSKIKEDTAEEESGGVGVIIVDDDDVSSDDYLSEVPDSDDDVDLDEAKERAVGETVALEDSKPQTTIIPKIDLGEPIRKEGYHEYHVQPKKRPPTWQDTLIRIEDLPDGERQAFGDLKTLNIIQSKIYKKAIGSDQSLLICAPTGAGKTNIALLTMLREILKYPSKDSIGYDVDKFKIIYVAPIKALVQEIVENFTKRLGCSPYNLKVEELTGDHQLDQRQISKAQIIVCTPEKWDIVTRKSLDRLYTKLVRLVIFDEIHLLHNERGATLEALVARIKRHKHVEGEPIRIVGLSATLPNYRDVSRFISPDETPENSTFYFDSSYRPIPLRQQYIAMTESKKAFRMINDIVYEKVIERLAEQAQVLIFVHSRPDTVKTGEFIKSKILEEHKLALLLSNESSREKVNEYGKYLSPKLKELLQFGIGTHHAGMSKTERSCVEDLFRGRYVKVLVSTATLAWGVNLPARTVIIKGTQVYRDGKWTDLDSLDVTQMLGRAGRPGYDKEGEGIVITQQSKVAFYMSLMNEQLPVESRLINRLAEFINAECVVGNIECLEDAVRWLSETYLSSRMSSVLHTSENRQYLALYGIDPSAMKNDPKLNGHKQNLAYTAACALDDRGLVVFDRSSGVITSTDLGRIASHYNCSSRTIKLFNDSIHQYTSDIELFRIFSMSDEFKEIYVRRGEEVDLQTLINQVPFPIDDKRATAGANKVNALLQVYIFKMDIEGSELICDMHFIRENAARVSRAIHEIVLMKGFALVAELSLDLCRKIDKRMTVCHTPLRQFPDDLDPDIINRLEKKNYHIDELRMLKSDKLTELLRCERKHGEKVYKMLKLLPRLKLEANIRPISKGSLRIDLTIRPDFSWSEKYHGYSENFWLFVEDVNQESLLHYEMIHIRRYSPSNKIKTTFYVPHLKPVHPFYYLRIFPDKWFGCDHHLPIYIEELNLPNESFVSTQPLDLEPQTIKSLENPLFERVYEEKLKGATFNQIQTQAFRQLYQSNDDIILLAPAGSGKTLCAELTVIRNINLKGTISKCGYVAANSKMANLVFENWIKIFGRHYGVVLLTGNHRIDASIVDKESTNIVIGDPENWHVLSLTRSKKYRNLMSKFQLFIIDDIHMLHSDKSSVLEWLCCKIRIITKMNAKDPARLVIMGSPVTCADSLRSWLSFERRSKEPTLLNYPPSIRPVKLELTIQKYHHYDYKMRLLSMQRPVYRYVTHTAREKPSLIFVADFKQAIDVCESLINYTNNEGRRLPRPMIKSDSIRDTTLKSFLKQGIGMIHASMDSNDRQLVEGWYDNQQISVLVATNATCWSLQCRSYLTIVMDTQQHNGLEPADYELSDVMQMVGLTGRPLADHECKCIIMCHSSKADFYDRFLREPLPVESELPANLIAHVNYEVATSSISELNDIYKPYLAHTFFYKRISINPNYYGIMTPDDQDQKSKVFGSFFNDLVNKVALDLEKTDFLAMEGTHENPTFSPGLISKISLEYYINFETLVNYSKWLSSNPRALELKTLELIELLSTNTFEFKNIQIRHGELQALKSLQRRHRPREGDQIHNSSFKIKLLILSQYQKNSEGKEDSVEGELVEDRRFIITMSHRLLMAIVDMAWLKDSFPLAKTALQLSKRIVPFRRSTRPVYETQIDMTEKDDRVILEIRCDREDEPYSLHEFQNSCRLTMSTFREEGWCFLIYGHSRLKQDDSDKFMLFKRVKTPTKGCNVYNLDLTRSELSEAYIYDLYFMSDFYPTGEDKKFVDVFQSLFSSEDSSKMEV